MFEGEVEFTPHGGGDPVLVKGGNAVSATQAVLGTVQTFDTDTELAKWNESVQQITATVNTQYGYNPLGQPEHRQFGVSEPSSHHRPSTERKFCQNCGKPVSVNSKFCSGCGQSIT